jgi:hypothetical protein
MNILHGTWVPGDGTPFENPGRFVLWMEQQEPPDVRRAAESHPFAATAPRLEALLAEAFPAAALRAIDPAAATVWAWLPSADGAPLPSPELGQLLGAEPPETFDWRPWQMAAMSTADPLLLLKELHFQAIQQEDRLRLGSDLRFWHGFSRAVRDLVRRQTFLPALFPWTG